MAHLNGLRVIDVPEAGRWIGPKMFRPIRGLCDFIVLNRQGVAAFVDTKSINDIRFPYSLVDKNQLEKLKHVGDLCPAGYVVCFRPVNRVMFIHWRMLEALGQRESIDMELCMDLGPINYFDVKKIFTCNRIQL